MPHGLGRSTRGLILLLVALAHGLVLLLPAPVHPPQSTTSDLQVQLNSSSSPQRAPAAMPPRRSPVAAEKPRVLAPTPLRSVAEPAVLPAPISTPPGESKVLPPQALPAEAGMVPSADVAGAGIKAASAVVAAPVVRVNASCDTRLLDSDYPSSARRDGLEGRVLVQVHILQSGLVQEPRVVKSSGSAVLDEAALKASQHWRCTPARQNGAAMDSRVAVPVVFRLND